MKRFVFPLERVLEFRRLEMQRVEAHAGELALRVRSALRTAEERRTQALESGRDLLKQRGLRGADFHVTRHWLARLEAERNKALDASEKLVQQHRQALGQLIEARRNAKLLEILRERRLKAHTRSIVKQSEAEAAELHLARRTRIGRCIC